MIMSRQTLGLGAALSVLVSIPACGSQNAGHTLLQDPKPRQESTNARPAMLIGSRAISRDAIWSLLAEYGGADIVREIVLDHAIAEELRRAGLNITEADIERERTMLMTRLAPGIDDESAAELSRVVLESRGLGPERLRGLLTRNAGLRKLIADEAEPTPETVELAYRVRFGAKREVRIMTAGSANAAQTMVDDVRRQAQDVGLLAAFAEIATRRSTDDSAPLGGSLGAISPDDPGLPVALRRALKDLAPMTLSTVVALDSGFALLLIESDVPAESTTLDEVYQELEADVRERQQRLMMESRARQLLSEYQPSVLDGSLRWSWERRGELAPR